MKCIPTENYLLYCIVNSKIECLSEGEPKKILNDLYQIQNEKKTTKGFVQNKKNQLKTSLMTLRQLILWFEKGVNLPKKLNDQ